MRPRLPDCRPAGCLQGSRQTGPHVAGPGGAGLPPSGREATFHRWRPVADSASSRRAGATEQIPDPLR
eukprot:2437306-Heterocapsa_arctica.AAC.1